MSDEWAWTNWYATRLHLYGESLTDRAGSPYVRAKCGCVVESYEKTAARRARYSAKTKPAADLPHCKLCQRKAQR